MFTQPEQYLDQDKSCCQEQRHGQREHTPNLQPGECGKVYTKPDRLAHDNPGRYRWCRGKSDVEVSHDGKRSGSQGNHAKKEQRPSCAAFWRGKEDYSYDPCPSQDSQGQGNWKERPYVGRSLFFHWQLILTQSIVNAFRALDVFFQCPKRLSYTILLFRPLEILPQ